MLPGSLQMKGFPALLILLALVSCSTPLERKLRELDDVIEHRGEFLARYEARGDSLRTCLNEAASDSARLDIASQLYNHYRYYQIDSSYHYLNMMMSFDCDSLRPSLSLRSVEISISLREYDNADRFLRSLDTLGMNAREKAQYYHNGLLLYANMAVDEMLPQSVRQSAMEKRYEWRRKYISTGTIDSFEWVRRNAIQLYEDGKPDEAIEMMTALYDQCDNIHQKEDVCYSMANAYLVKGDMDMVKYWFAQSAVYSLSEPNRVYLSLYELAMILFRENDLSRASTYIRIAIEDALDCNYSPRLFNSVISQLDLAKAVDYKNRMEKMGLVVVISMFTILLSLIAFLFVQTYRQSEKLRRMYHLLEESNKIKEGYVFKYISMSVGYLGLIEEFRHDLRVAMKKSDTQALNRLLKDPRYYEGEFQKFYMIFDETFLGIYPDFVEKVNSLLREEARFELKKDGELPTGLRILAAIKLGITESGKIAQFLSCAPSSVYTHRCKIKKMALCAPDDFEKRVSEI